MTRRHLGIVSVLVLAACGYARPDRPFPNLPAGAPLPPLLSQAGVFADLRTLAPLPALVPYDLNHPFWSDGATKTRWAAVPDGQRVRFAPTGDWSFPAGTVFVKHFEEPAGGRLETRVLVRAAAAGVYGASYRWRPDGSDADLVKDGRREGGRYYPGVEDCAKCHTPSAGGVLGPNARQMNRDFAYPGGTENQIRHWARAGLFDRPPAAGDIPRLTRLAAVDDATRSVEDRTRSFLDVNCAYCHRPGGAVADFDARYDTPLAKQLLIDVPARINLGVDRARFVAPNDVWRSTVLARVNTLDGTKMPPLGHETIDRRAVDVLRAWVTSLPGPPVVAPPAISPNGGDFRSVVRVTLRHADPAAVIRYTVDGLPPGPDSPAYTGPLELNESVTLRARAFRPGHTTSITVQETFVVGD